MNVEKKVMILTGIVAVLVIGAWFIANHNEEAGPDFRNFYGISWVGQACDNLAYARSMGYDYVNWQDGMEKCPPDAENPIYFYIEAPEAKALPETVTYWQIDYAKTYTQAQKDAVNAVMAWKSNDAFPNNLATGWFFSMTSFRPNPDYQRQSIIDKTVQYSITNIKKKENATKGLLFGGYSWDVPDLRGDWWTARQYTSGHSDCTQTTCTGKNTDLSYWNTAKIESAYNHLGVPYDYPTYTEARAALMKKLFSETKKQYPDMKIVYEPYGMYRSWIQKMETRSDARQLMPVNEVLLLQEDGDGYPGEADFALDPRVTAKGLITKEYTGSSTPDTHDYSRNLVISATAMINGGWFTWFGRTGGTNGAPRLEMIQVPNKLKLVRAITGWENVNDVALKDRKWDATKQIYTSPNTYADTALIYSRHPKNHNIYAVFVSGMPATINLKFGESVVHIYAVDGLFMKGALADDKFIVSGSKIIPKVALQPDAGYIIEVK